MNCSTETELVPNGDSASPFKKNRREYTIHDRLVDGRVHVKRSLLEQPKFDLARWYATRRIKALDLGTKPVHRETMGHAIHMVATKLITNGIASHYPCMNPNLDPQDSVCIT